MSARPSENEIVIPLSICFKGERDYLQGGDIYNAVTEGLASHYGSIDRFHLAFHGFLKTLPELRVADGEAGRLWPTDIAAAVRFECASGARHGWLLATGQPVTCRFPFDEDAIRRHCRISSSTNAIRTHTPYSPIEVAVAMTKHLHNALLPQAAGRWIFTRLEMGRLLRPADSDGLDITLRDNMHNRLTKSEIRAHGEPIGFIFFSLLVA